MPRHAPLMGALPRTPLASQSAERPRRSLTAQVVEEDCAACERMQR